MRAVAIHGAIAVGLLSVAVPRLDGQSRADSARCDSIVASAAVDSAKTAIFVSVEQTDHDWLSLNRGPIETSISQDFSAPRPFRLSVLEGPSLVRGLRISSPDDSVGVRRGASVIGTYRVDVSSRGTITPVVVRASLLPGFDAAVLTAISTAALMRHALRPPFGGSWRLLIHVSTDSSDDSRRIAQGVFPVMRVRDANPLTRERPPFPEAARADSLDHGEAVLRFVVDRDGKPALETVEVVRASTADFARAAIVALDNQRFNAATIRGCAVAQLVEFPFVFDAGDRQPPRDR
jgi:TonB family protein